MVPSRETITGLVCIVTVVAVAMWYAGDLQTGQWPSSRRRSTWKDSPSLPETSIGYLDWSADGSMLLSQSRTIEDGEGSLTVHSMNPGTQPIPIDTEGVWTGAAALAPDGRHILAGTRDRGLRWIDAETSASLMLAGPSGRQIFTAVAIAGNAGPPVVAAGTSTGSILLCEPDAQAINPLTADRG